MDWNSNFQSPLVWTNEKLGRIFFSHKDLFAIKKSSFIKFIIKFIVYDKLSIKTRTITVLLPSLFPSFFLPHYDTILLIAVISIFIEGSHIFLKIISNFMLLERPLSLKQIFHYYTQINQQRDRIVRMQQLTSIFFSFFSLFCCWFVLVFLLFFLFYFFQFQHFSLFFFFLFFPRRSVPFPSFLFFFLLVCSCFFFFTSFHSSILLCPLRCCRVVMLKTAVYSN